MYWLIVPSIAGALVGAALLRVTPPALFERLVPALIFFATLLFALQDRVQRFLNISPEHHGSQWLIAAIGFQFLVSVYGGYFGAGMGILMLAALGLIGLTDLHQMNGLKNLLAICINGVAAIYFALSGAVLWRDAVIMAVAAIAGGYAGARVARKLGRKFVRGAVVFIGVAMTIALWLRR
jgi:uncharacterized membrane protein YfcA